MQGRQGVPRLPQLLVHHATQSVRPLRPGREHAITQGVEAVMEVPEHLPMASIEQFVQPGRAVRLFAGEAPGPDDEPQQSQPREGRDKEKQKV